MFAFFSSPFGLVALGLGVLAVAVLALCFWITTLDRRMRGMADGLEAERRKVAEMQMIIGRRNNAARSYGGGRPRGAVPASAAGMPQTAVPAGVAPTAASPVGAPLGGVAAAAGRAAAGAAGAAGVPMPNAGMPVPGVRPRVAQAAAPGVRPAPAPRRRAQQGTGSIDAAQAEAWIQGGAGQPVAMPDKRMSRRARREAERAFAARAAAELEARQARRAQEAAMQRPVQPGVRPYGGAAAPLSERDMATMQSMGAMGAIPRTAQPVPGTPVPMRSNTPVGQPAPVPAGRGRHAR